MKIVYSWLKDFVDLDVDAKCVETALTAAGIEVANIAEVRIPQGVKVARVVEREQHPNADKLSLCRVDDGSGGEPLQIVCGAPNVSAGMTVALATVGTQIAPDFKIGKAKIRGVESFGMLCSEKELGLSEAHEGIMSLPSEWKVGAPLSDYVAYDAVIEIEITPNRGDCLSVLGVAREVAARLNLPLKNPAMQPQSVSNCDVANEISVTVEDADRCPRYMGRLVRGVKIAPSPEWMQRRLSMAGLRPINNVVDITNYILLQFGQPMHAFDYNAIAEKKIIVKTARAASVSEFVTLDGVTRKLAPEDLLICDGARPVALAGIMGGAGSEITEATKDVFLECAFFSQGGVRKTSKRLGLSTDSSYRFERGVDAAQGLVNAIDTAAELMRQYAGGEVAKNSIDVCANSFNDKEITLRVSQVEKILGVKLASNSIIALLNSIKINALETSNGIISCTVPFYRHDIEIEADLIEEVGRMYGYDNIPVAQKATIDLVRAQQTAEENRDRARAAMCYFGFNEIMTNSMVSESKRKLVTPNAEAVSIMNPLNPDMAEMRTSMAASLLETLAYNLNRKNRNNRLFEIGKTFAPKNDGSGLAVEKDILAIIVEGSCFPKSWGHGELPNDFFVLKGIIEAFAANCAMGDIVCSKHDGTAESAAACPALAGPLYGSECAALAIGGNILGSMGKVSAQICNAFGIKSVVYYAGLDLTAWLAAEKPLAKYVPLPKFPALERDFSFVMPETLSSDTVVREISGVSALIKSVRPFDVYKGENLAPKTKSVAFSVEFRTPEKTLTDDDVADACAKIVKVMETKHGAKLRA